MNYMNCWNVFRHRQDGQDRSRSFKMLRGLRAIAGVNRVNSGQDVAVLSQMVVIVIVFNPGCVSLELVRK
jgi:hypothetical protein